MNYTMGLDFGSLSGRGVLVDTATGTIVTESVWEYPHGILEERLPHGTRLPPNWALQDPMDYLAVLDHVIPSLLQKSGLSPQSVVAIGVDFTACTLLPVKENGSPLSQDSNFFENPHAWCKLWKHHAAIREAEEITAAAKIYAPEKLSHYGGCISPEALFPKLLQVYREAPEVYQAAHRFLEAGDWVVEQLVGHPVRSGTMASCKAMWDKETGYPDKAFFASLGEDLKTMPQEKLLPENCDQEPMIFPGRPAGTVSPQAAKRFGLRAGTVVTPSHSDGHVGVASVGITGPGKALLTIGTSVAIIFQDTVCKEIPGMCSIVPHCDYPGLVGYAAGQCSVGDCFQWFMERCLPEIYCEAAREAECNRFAYVEQLAAKLKPGQSGLLALDWWNGNRSCLQNADLSGMLIGLTLQTKPEEIYRALLEAVAFGANKIFQTMEQCGETVDVIYACGGIALKNPLLMQIYADVLGKPVHVSTCNQVPALGAAIFAAAAVGKEQGGWDTIDQAIQQMSWKENILYTPDSSVRPIYDMLQQEYDRLHDYFGRGENNIMKTLRRLRAQSQPQE